MKTRIIFVSPLVLVLACFAKDPCGEGFFVGPEDNLCHKIAPPSSDAAAPPPVAGDAGLASGEAGGDAPADAAPAATFGTPCASAADCGGGKAPICGAPQLPYCTQINCLPTEANAGVCPDGYTCLKVGDYPSVCFRQ